MCESRLFAIPWGGARVKCARPLKLIKTYDDDTGEGTGDRSSTRLRTAGDGAEGDITGIDGIDKHFEEYNGARVVKAVELGSDGIDRIGEVDKASLLDVGDRPLRRSLDSGASKGHSTGGEDSEDGRESHDEEEFGKADWAESDRRC